MPHPIFLGLDRNDVARQEAYRALFRPHLEQAAAIDDIRLALNQSQPLGDSRFHGVIERAVGERRQARPRGRPKADGVGTGGAAEGQDLLEL